MISDEEQILLRSISGFFIRGIPFVKILTRVNNICHGNEEYPESF